METFNTKLIRKIHKAFKSKGLSLSVAESCTAGLISHMLTSLPNASGFFDSSVVSYSSTSKIRLLGIKKSLIKKHGTISEEVARAMAEAIREKIETDFSLAITGNLGPKGLEGKEVGLVFIAVSCQKETTSRGFIFDGSRQEIKHAFAISALKFLYEVVSLWT